MNTDEKKDPIPTTATTEWAAHEEIALRGVGQRLELHHRLNEATAIQRVLEQPGITTLAAAKDAVRRRLDALMVLERQLQPGPESLGNSDHAPGAVLPGEEEPWH